MQIDGTVISSIYPALSDKAGQGQNRLPVTLEAKPDFKQQFVITNQESNSELSVIDVLSQPIQSYEQQQSQFIRNFANQSEPSSNNNLPALPPPALPRGVKQYLEIGQINSTENESIIDERV
jgi:hypothetical protein